MRPSFLTRLVNGPLFDPVVFVRLLNQKTALLFDCGHLEGISNREILSVESLCISHPHMDHFMGFDQVLRVILHRDRPLHVYGPEGIMDKIISKLGSYTWNLTDGYLFEVIIHEVRDHEIITSKARACDAFRPSMPVQTRRQGTTIASHTFYSVDALVLDHNVPCLGYIVKEPFHLNIKAARIAELGYTTGPWLGMLKQQILAGRMDGLIDVSAITGTVKIRVQDLYDDLVVISAGQTIAYITDIRASDENLKCIVENVHDVDILYIEAYYLAERLHEARQKAHLTAQETGLIARLIRAKKIVPMHVSPRYHHRMDEIMAELEAARSE
jgi:ribonuclease Z